MLFCTQFSALLTKMINTISQLALLDTTMPMHHSSLLAQSHHQPKMPHSTGSSYTAVEPPFSENPKHKNLSPLLGLVYVVEEFEVPNKHQESGTGCRKPLTSWSWSYMHTLCSRDQGLAK